MKQLPIPSDELLRQAFRIIELEDKNNVKRNSDVLFDENRLILTSPNGTKFRITVSNLGIVTAIAI